ncbi:MAG: hypothetical protein DHS20C21_17720 [Gemmatimonadota bacterium]|nr:MAG: hypothetical protein DHS20C21_17720 [Gemmatimonadota bacterium]
MSVHRTLMALTAVVLLLWAQGCDRTINLVEETSGDMPLSCAECHDSSDLITGVSTQWAASVHGSGTAYGRGTSASCAGCHSGSAFVEMLAAGLDAGSVEEGDPDPTRQDCRACHMIHETYTFDDFDLRTIEPVSFYAIDGVTFDGGTGNLCVNCHQPRRVIPAAEGGVISGISTHWGPHHGPQSAMLLGLGGGPGVTGTPHGHYGAVENSCAGCHMGEGANHTFEPEVETCQVCHPGATNFDYNGVQTEIQGLSDTLGGLLLTAGLIDENSPDGHPTVSSAPEDQAIALWNWLYVAHEDQSLGVHNADYARALLQDGIARMTP